MDILDKNALSKIDEKGFIPDDVRDGIFRKLRMKNENRTCFECTARNPTWISLTYGVYLCLECSGEHRRKGVHISFVRSVELDKFTPDQIVHMAAGGNGKAWTHFKQHGMGKTSDTRLAVQYTSKFALRYKQDLEKTARSMCDELSVASKASGGTAVVVDPIDEATEVAGPVSPMNMPAAPPAASPAPKAKPAPTPAPTNVVVRRSESAADATPSNVPRPSGFANPKQKAKQIDFDFDFDDLEAEASKPAPVRAEPEPIMSSSSASVSKPAAAPVARPQEAYQARSQPPAEMGKYNNKKAISSDDFFGDEARESAGARMERENRYNKFSSAGAISSNAFFGDGGPEDDMQLQRSDSGEDWKAVASMATGKGVEMAKQGISMGAEFITTYLNKVRD
mmetsp:Transcript_42390/g.119897  ORF Transcript_42390/g.119897 Transcript_42390/m.119897 type:complete len:395 (+) Transcript_42390:83-1267(+)